MTALQNLDQIIQQQKDDHVQQGSPSLAWRQEQITTAIRLLKENNQAIIEAVNKDYAYRSASLTQYADIDSVISTLEYANKRIAKWMKPSKRYLPIKNWLKGERAYVEYQPLGVVGVMAPWNGPVALLFLSLAGIFSAGNRVVLKPSHQTPATAELVKKLVAQYFPPEIASVVTGDLSFAQNFAQANFDHLLYTGNSETGAQVMQQAAKQLTPVTLELGGSSPVVISESAALEQTVEKVVSAKMLNAGQICIAPDAVYVPEQKLKSFVSACQQSMQVQYPQAEESEEYPAIFSDEQELRLQRLIENALSHQAEYIALLDNKKQISPCLLINPAKQSDICQQEIFGPLIRVHTYKNIQEVSTHIQETQAPLALYYFGSEQAEITHLKQHVLSGGMTINDVMVHAFTPNLPFGGVGKSGMGRYGGLDGFKNFSNSCAIYQKKP